ncbi:t-SNARE [Mycena galericulata]|nr:t-SNARE [Mycena galericulata]
MPPKYSSSSSTQIGEHDEQLRSSLSLQLFKINANVQGIHALAETLGTARDSASLRARLRDLTDTTRALAQRASNDANQLVVARGSQPQNPALRKIITDLDVSVRNFQAAQRFSLDRQRRNINAPIAVQVPSEPEPLVNLSDSQPQTQTVVYSTEAAYRDAEILARQNAIREIEDGMIQLAEITRNIAVLVDRQGEDIVIVQSNAERTANELERGAYELHIAARRKRRARRMCLPLILGVVCAAVIVVILI